MDTIVKTPSGTWKAVIRKTGWPTSSKTFRTKRESTRISEHKKAQPLLKHFGKYSLAALSLKPFNFPFEVHNSLSFHKTQCD